MRPGSNARSVLARRALSGAFLLVLLAGCGGRAARNEATSTPQGAAPGTPSPAAVVTTAASAVPKARASAAQAPAARPIRTPTGKPQVGKTSYPLDVTIDPPCGSPGTGMTATISTGPKAKISVVVGYSDAKDRGQKAFLDADEKGRAVYQWTILPDAPMGEGRVLVSAGDGNNHGNGGAWPFVVAPRGEC